jgi:predicted TIM-barrel fold metal-dependent hydrolase
MKICDAHVHLGESGPWQPYGNPTIYVDDLLQLLTKYHIARALVFPNPNVGDTYPRTNDYIARCVREHAEKLVGFGRVDPRRDKDAAEELGRIKKRLRLSGVKLHPMVECFRPDHPFFDRFFRKVDELKLPILMHTGDGFSAPGLAAKVAKKYPEVVMILAHLREGCVSALKDLPNIYVETSGTLPEFVEMAVDVDENRVLFGSDIPYYRFPTQTAIVDAAEISLKTRRKVYSENFNRLFKE